MRNTTVQVLSIHDSKDLQQSIDLKDILRVLKTYLHKWTWCITELDVVGNENSEEVCDLVEKSRPKGLCISSAGLVKLAEDIQQTIDARFVAFPKDINVETLNESEVSVACFVHGHAELALIAVDGCWFDVFTKDPEIAKLLHDKFQDVRDQDVANFFAR